MDNTIEKAFKERVLESAKNHKLERDSIGILNAVFNLKMAMTIDEINTIIAEEKIKIDEELYVCELDSRIEGINKLYFWVSDDFGLYSVFAINEGIEGDNFGLNLKKMFFSYEKIFEIGYGKYAHNETSLKDLKNNYNSWLSELENNTIELETLFNETTGATLCNDIHQILIGATKEKDENPSIIIVYKFNNAKD